MSNSLLLQMAGEMVSGQGFSPSPLHGAAYRVLIERFDPMSCSTDDALVKMREELRGVIQWAMGVSPEIADVYRYAANLIEVDAIKRLAVFKNARATNKAYGAIPKPPSL